MSSKNKSSIRWIDLTEEEKKQVLRIRNADSARRSRQKKQDNQSAIEKVCEENEKRINHLEKVIRQLSDEIEEKSSSSKRTTSSKGRPRNSSSSSTYPDGKRPDWFGDPFWLQLQILFCWIARFCRFWPSSYWLFTLFSKLWLPYVNH